MNNAKHKPSSTPSTAAKLARVERFVIYRRVSTSRQGISGLGLESQEELVNTFLASRPHEIIGLFTEVESGKRNDRPELLKALELCRKCKAILVIAKLDRLGRNLSFIANLMDAGIEFICCDNPTANRLMLHMLGAFAEFERELISRRTKDALAMAKARGIALGANGRKLAKQNKEAARLRDLQHYPVICNLMRELRSYRAVADRLNQMAVVTPAGGKWHGAQIRNVYLRP